MVVRQEVRPARKHRYDQDEPRRCINHSCTVVSLETVPSCGRDGRGMALQPAVLEWGDHQSRQTASVCAYGGATLSMRSPKT